MYSDGRCYSVKLLIYRILHNYYTNLHEFFLMIQVLLKGVINSESGKFISPDPEITRFSNYSVFFTFTHILQILVIVQKTMLSSR